MSHGEDQQVLQGFHPAVRAWFVGRFGVPSPPQQMGWPAIRSGHNVLILAATGTGKTLAAFLEVLSRLCTHGTGQGTQALYVSPLKALNNDIAQNLMDPLRGVAKAARQLGLTVPEIKVAVRTGDTPQSARQAMLRKPPDILITTPESLYLMLSSPRARVILQPVHTAIVDEIHALAGNKRGVHLALSLERLEHLAGRALQRIGLSATQRPLELIARYLGGLQGGVPRPVKVLDARQSKRTVIRVSVDPGGLAPAAGTSIWPAIYARVLGAVEEHRSTLVFVNSRALAERLALGINELAGCTIARTHHGSLSRKAREEVEAALKAGTLRALVCTSTLELGIDVGAIDLVIQICSPRSASGGLQRVGRSGHVLGAASEGLILAKSPDDLLDAAWVARAMLEGAVEETRVPENCLDVLAQHIVSMVGTEEWSLHGILALVQRCHSFRSLTREQLLPVVEMLSGRYPARDYVELRPKLAWDRAQDTLRALPGTRAVAVAGAGTIPDRAYFPVYLAGQNVRLGELEEEFVHESRTGDAFLLGNSVWRVRSISDHRVTVTPAPDAVAKVPFWRGSRDGRGLEVGRQVGAFWRELVRHAHGPGAVEWLAGVAGLDAGAAEELVAYVTDQLSHSGCVPSDRCLVLESYVDQAGDYRVILHSPYGYRVHSAWEMAARQQVREETGLELVSVATDYGIAWHVPRGEEPPPLESLVYLGSDVEQRLMHDLPSTALFAAHFRMNAARSLVLGRSSPRRRIPLWLQRIKAGDLLSLARQEPDFPVALETFRECLHDVLDVPGFVELQEELAAGTVRLEYRHSAVPSPFARTFILQLTAANMYSDDTPRAEKKAQFLALDRDLLQEMLGEEGLRSLLEPEAIAATVERRQRLAGALSARSADELEEVLLDVGELAAEEVAKRVSEPGALGSLLAGGRAVARSFASPPVTRYLAAEEEALYIDAYGPAGAKQHMARGFLLKRYARTHGPFRTGEPTARYGWPVEEVEPVLDELRRQGWLAKGAFLPGGSGAEWCHRDVLEEVHRRTLSVLRREVEAVAPADYARFLLQWQGVAGPGPAEDSPDGLAQVLDQLAGLFLPVEVWERDVLRSRLPTFGPAWLDLLCARGEFTWILQPGGRHGRLGFLRRADVQRVLPLFLGSEAAPLSPEAQAVEAFLRQRGAAFVSELISPEAGIGSGTVVQDALWELALAGRVSNDTFEPVRRGRPHVGGFVESGHSRSGQRETRPDLRRAIRQRVAAAMNAGGGRWAVLPGASSGSPPEESAPGRESLERLADMLLERWGMVCRDMLVAEGLERHWPALHRVLQVFGMTGRARSGYFVTTLGGPQFAHPRAVEALREARGQGKEEHQLQLLSSCDPALTMGPLFPAGLPSGASFSRSSLNYAVVCQGRLILYVGGFGRSLWSPDDADGEALSQALLLLPRLLAVPGHQRPRRSLTVATLNGRPVAETSAGATLEQAGFEASADVWVLWPSRVQG